MNDRYSIADIALYAYTHVAEDGGHDLEPYPNLREWLGRVAAQPNYVPPACDGRHEPAYRLCRIFAVGTGTR